MSWREDELKLKPGWEALAQAVVKQWKIDGQPKGDMIEPWIKICELSDKTKNIISKNTYVCRIDRLKNLLSDNTF